VVITPAFAAPRLLRIATSAPDMAVKVRRRLRAILDLEIEHGFPSGNPLPATRRTKRTERRHFPAVLDRSELGKILRRACCWPSLNTLAMVRPGDAAADTKWNPGVRDSRRCTL